MGEGDQVRQDVAPASTWKAIVWAEAFLLVGLVFVAFSVGSEWASCDFIGGCTPEQNSSTEPESIVWLVFAAGAALVGTGGAALRSGWPLARALVQGSFALGSGVAAALLGWELAHGHVDEIAPALVLAVGVSGAMAIRPSHHRAVQARVIALGFLLFLAFVLANSSVALVALPLLTLPTLGLADALAVPAIDRERESAD